MRTQFCHAAVALALIAGAGAANAQTVITREITTEPVETIIERGPTGTVITRRPLGTLPRSAVTDTVVSEPVETITRSRETVGSVTTTEADEPVTRRVAPRPARAAAPRKTVTKAKAQPRRAAEPPARAPARAVTTTRTTTGVAPAETVVALSPAQRSMIYRTILEERVVPRTTVVTRPLLPAPFGVAPFAPFAPATREVVTEQVITRPSGSVVVDPIDSEPVVTRRVVTAPREVAVGARVPATVPLYALPDTIVRQVPGARSYQYAVIEDRVFLVDPETSLITAELND